MEPQEQNAQQFKALSEALAQGALNNSLVQKKAGSVEMIDQEAFHNQDIFDVNPDSHPPQVVRSEPVPTSVTPQPRQGLLSAMAQKARAFLHLNRTRNRDNRVNRDNIGSPHGGIPSIPQLNQEPGDGVLPVWPIQVSQQGAHQSTPTPSVPTRNVTSNIYNLRSRSNVYPRSSMSGVFGRVPWWVLLLSFLFCLATLGCMIVWVFRLRRAALNASTVVTPHVPRVFRHRVPLFQRRIVRTAEPTPVIVQKTKVIQPQPPVVAKPSVVSNVEQVVKTKPTQPAPVVQSPPEKEDTGKSSAGGAFLVIPQRPEGFLLYCPKDTFTFNMKCYRCPNAQTWNGENCISRTLKHLRRV